MIQPAQLHVYATTKPSRDVGRNAVCGRCGRVRGIHIRAERYTTPFPLCGSCKSVLAYDGWTEDQMKTTYGKAT